jgi:hypothetical protein
MLAGGLSFPVSVSLFSNAVYWANDIPLGNSAFLCPIEWCLTSGCMGGPSQVSRGEPFVSDLAVDATGVYWSTGDDIRNCPLIGCSGAIDGGSGATIVVPPVGSDGLPTSPGGLTIDALNLYWTTGDPTNGQVQKCPKSGCPRNADGGSIVQSLATAQQGPDEIAVDATSVYWLNLGNVSVGSPGSVMKCPLSGCPIGDDGGTSPIVLASGQSFPSQIALDATSVYWVNRTSGTIMKVAK